MADSDGPKAFRSSEELIVYLRSRVDDVQDVLIPVQSKIQVAGPEGQRHVMGRVGAWIRLCGGDSILIGREDAAMLINDGVLQRLGIPCVLDPLE